MQPAIDSLNRSADELKAVPGAGREPIPAAFMVACAAAWMPLENAIGGYATRTDLGADAREILEDVTQELAILRRALYHAASQWSELLIQEAASAAVEWIDLASRRTPSPILSHAAAAEAARLSQEVDPGE